MLASDADGGREEGGVGISLVGVAGRDHERAGSRAFPGTGLRTLSESSPAETLYHGNNNNLYQSVYL